MDGKWMDELDWVDVDVESGKWIVDVDVVSGKWRGSGSHITNRICRNWRALENLKSLYL